ncbi:alpha/beta hydrolase fold domain-containing protein [Streptomyces kaniharaensis]|uniref:Alpha/beta hydrolase fold domain-containing protein n=1 Tax=Streptomyces kaniharaensis TaxID=212423 RepID=A0A6N7KVF1_9ACTN|nr:alpha/beta hydrolase fold domain-containing protein [Streptomyces kaniharaensis]MQS15431.1 alpha/beta hydrolase fold domain-containing protein [Streptomyces kaniharaensis]
MTSTRPEAPEVVLYADGRPMDVHRPPAGTAGAAGPVPVVLLWHGRGPDERDVLRPLAREAAGYGLLVLVPDWRSDRADGGRAELLASLAHAREAAPALGGDPDRLVLAGWSMGGREAVAVAVADATPAELRPVAAVGIASSYDRPAVTTGEAPLDVLAGRPAPVPLWLVHGTADEVLGAEHTRRLSTVAPTARLYELPTDHAGVVMTEYDPAADRCLPATAAGALEAGRRTAAVLAEAAGPTDPPGR